MGFPTKYWCYTENWGTGGLIRTYVEITSQEHLEHVEKTRASLPNGWKGFITDSYFDAELYAND